jgi:hypothetical protein
VAEPTASPSGMTPPEQTVARARAIARDLGARLFISPSNLELYDELESFLAADAPAMRAALAALDELSPAQLRRRLAAIGAPVLPEHDAPAPAAATPAQAGSAGTEDSAAEDGYVSPWPNLEPRSERWQETAAPTVDAPVDEDDSWLREWDREALLGGVEQ